MPQARKIIDRISTLSNFFKIFEKLIYNQIFEFMNHKLSKYITGFRKKNIQHTLLKMIETWILKLNYGNKIGALIMNLSKAFNTINHDLFLSSEAILQTGTRERKLVALSVIGAKSLLGFLRVRYYDRYSSAFSLMICFYLQTNLKFDKSEMLMITLSTLLIKTLGK